MSDSVRSKISSINQIIVHYPKKRCTNNGRKSPYSEMQIVKTYEDIILMLPKVATSESNKENEYLCK